MGRPFHEKYSVVVWESSGSAAKDSSGPDPDTQGTQANFDSGGNFQKWKDGKTGYPIVDAGMRCVKEMGWMHNRLRMICAMFLTKHLMIDWREGEKVNLSFCALAEIDYMATQRQTCLVLHADIS
jgi:deoxyribodipyrimidine photo-lyase